MSNIKNTLSELIRKNPQIWEMWINLKIFYYSLKLPILVKIDLSEAAAKIYFDWAKLLGTKGRVSEAIDRCKNAIEIKPDWAEVYLLLALLYREWYFQVEHNERMAVANQAAACCERVIELNPDRIEVYELLGNISFFMQARFDESVSSFAKAIELRRKWAERNKLNNLGIQFIPRACAQGIGCTGYIDTYVKAGILWGTEQKWILLSPPEKIANPCLLDYWRQYITVIDDPVAIESLLCLENHLKEPIDYVLPCKQEIISIHSGQAEVVKAWEAEGRSPLLRLSDAHKQRGWKCLESLGVPKDAWFVCLHVRESGFYGEVTRDEKFRNADVENYLLAVKTVVKRGGWVIRMGDPTMKPLPKIERVIDYAHSEVRSDWMDIFCCAQCRFFIGSNSGLHQVAFSFGVPRAQTNFLPLTSLALTSKDIFIPKLCWYEQENRYLTFAEMMSPPFNGCYKQLAFDSVGIYPVENAEDEINDLAIEMLERLDGKFEATAADECLQAQFKSIQKMNNCYINGQIGNCFLQKHSALLSRPEAKENKIIETKQKVLV